MKNPSISIIIPAYNEENTLSTAVNEAKRAINGLFDDYEILIFDDCSKDKTGLIADEITKSDEKIKVIHNPKNMGLGYNYVEGVRLACKDFVIFFPGDNENTTEGVRTTLKYAGKADIILPYPINPEVRPLSRRLISKAYIILINLLIGLNLKYYNGLVLHKSGIIKNVNITTYSFAFQAEILSKLLRSGHSYIEVPSGEIRKRKYGKPSTFKLNNLMGIFKTILSLFWNIRIKNRKLYNKKPIRIEYKN